MNEQEDKKECRSYFLKQRAIGIFLLVLTIISVILLDGDATIALFTVPVSFMLIFTKKRYWMNDYYFETEDEKDRDENEESVHLQPISSCDRL